MAKSRRDTLCRAATCGVVGGPNSLRRRTPHFRSPPPPGCRGNAVTTGGGRAGLAARGMEVNPGSKAAQRGVREGDIISSINGQATRNITNSEAHGLLKTAGQTLQLGLNE
ncbi:Uncharacterized protein GBIM_02113 [Gryllus bimaculatus]|nr:Uncharacterized protein GBIM_02113 [Gryllus bimaculatus]